MVALLWLVSALVLGAGLVRWLRLRAYPFEVVALSVVLGLFLWSWLALLLSLMLPYSFSLPLASGIGLLAGAGLWQLSHRQQWRPLEGGRNSWITWGVFTALLTIGLTVLFWTHSLLPEADGIYSAGSTWSDFGMHASLISHLAATDRLPFDLPIASGTRLTYPLLIDWLSAVFIKGGWGLHLSLFIPGLLLAWSVLQLVISFGLRLFGRLGGALTGLTLFILGGSAVGLDVALADFNGSGQSLGQFLSDIPRNYSGIDQFNAHFNNFIADILLPQRGYLFGLGTFLTVAIMFILLRQGGKHLAWRYRLTAGVLIGLLPFAHPHSFIAIMALLAALTAEALLRKQPQWHHWLAIFGVAIIVALPQLLWQQLANGNGTGGFISPGWQWQPGESIWLYWWHNFGLIGPYFIGLLLILLQQKRRKYLVWYAPFALILIITQLYSFQPVPYDNLKLILYVYLMAMLFAGAAMSHLVQRSWAAALLVAPLVLTIITPGTLTIIRDFQLHYQFASRYDIELANWVRTNTAPDTIFLTTDRPNQPIATLTGRPIVMGYRGWLYTYNLDYRDREAALLAAINGQANQPIVKKFGARYLAVAQFEWAEWVPNYELLDQTYPVAYRNTMWTVYQLP